MTQGRWTRYEAARGRSALDVIRERFEHGRVRDFIAWLAFLTVQRVDRPGELLTVAPYDVAGGWEAERERYARAHVDHVASRVDGMAAADVLAVVAEGPPDLERRNRHNVGPCHGGRVLGSNGRVLVRLAGSPASGAGALPDRFDDASGRIGGGPGRPQRRPHPARRPRPRLDPHHGPRLTPSE